MTAELRKIASTIEPGILPLFRIFVALEILLLLLRIGLEATFRADFPLIVSPWPSLAVLVFLFAYLSSPTLQHRLGRAYLPVALLCSILLTLLSAAAGMKLQLERGIRAEELVRGAWILLVVLLVPLIVVGWQYGRRWVLWFCAMTTAGELALTLPISATNRLLQLTLVVIAVVRCLFFLLVGYAVARFADAERQQRQALADAKARLAGYAGTLEELAVSRERSRLAHELHDTLAHGLSSLAVQLEAMSVLWKQEPQTVRKMLSETLAGTRQALHEARRAIAALRARPLEDLGLARAIRQAAEAAAARTGFELDLRVADTLDGLDAETEQAMYRIATEALANVERHAQARRVTVSLGQEAGRAILVVADDGRGFDAARISDDNRFGLHVMQERARLVGGELDIDATRGSGTTVRLSVRRIGDTRPDL